MKVARREEPGIKYEQRDPDWDYLVQADRINRSVYTDSKIFEREMVNVFGNTWVYVGHESEIPNNNDFVTRRFGGRPVILIRDRQGDIQILFNRCTHRGATVCREARGNQKVFVCPYHAWSYDSSGSSLVRPLDHAYAESGQNARYNLLKVPRVATYRGFIFGTLSEDISDLETNLAGIRVPFDDWIDHNDGGNFVVSGVQTFRIDANWKLITDNQGDGYHPPFSHRSLLTMTSRRYGSDRDMNYFLGNPDDTEMYAKVCDNGHYYIDQRPEMHSESGWNQQRPQPGREHSEEWLRKELGEEEAQQLLDANVGAGMNLTIFPNLMLIGNQIQVSDPIAVGQTDLYWFATTIPGAPAEINTMRLRTQEDFPLLGEADDVENFEACQQGLGIPEDEWIDCSRHLDSKREIVEEDGTRAPVTTELTIRNFYREWKRLMGQERRIDLSDQRSTGGRL
jgi:phenylpropionate dioxygenase-like ring-hydroxylating dioxygenase large terminal subunit